MKKQIFLPAKAKTQLQKDFNTTRPTVWSALNFLTDSSFAPVSVLKRKYQEIKDLCKEVGVEFYCAENRLRYIGRDLCCCGIDGLDGFTPNQYNLNHYLYDKSAFLPTKAMREKGSCGPFKAICQNTVSVTAFRNSSLEDMMSACTKDKKMIMQLTDKY